MPAFNPPNSTTEQALRVQLRYVHIFNQGLANFKYRIPFAGFVITEAEYVVLASMLLDGELEDPDNLLKTIVILK